MHLTLDHYLRALRGELPLLALAHHAHLHLRDVCDRCAADWRRYGGSALPVAPVASEAAPLADARHLRRALVEDAKRHLSVLRAVAREAREDLRRLFRLPPELWHDRVAGARTRMCSRTFAEALLAEARARLSEEPRQAERLAALVLVALRWTEGRTDLRWVEPVLERAAALGDPQTQDGPAASCRPAVPRRRHRRLLRRAGRPKPRLLDRNRREARRPRHLSLEDYVAAERRPDGAGLVARDAHLHLVERCEDCAVEWRRLGELRPTYLGRLRALSSPPPDTPREALLATPAEVAEQAAVTDDLIRLYRNVLGEKSELLRTAASRRVGKIRGAHRRFRSALLAEMLIEECRKRVRNAPAEAQAIVELVPEVLGWSEGTVPVPEWAPVLLAQAAAHRANALRVGGDLRAAERVFTELRRKLADRPLASLVVAAEIVSLEASLCIDQRRFEEAEERLESAAIGYRAAGDRNGLARCRLQQVNLLGTVNRPADQLALLDGERIGAEWPPVFRLAATTARVNALCDLDRCDEAAVELRSSLDVYEASDDLHAGAIYRWLQGRVALGQGRTEDARLSFSASREAMLTLGRGFDAALVTLHLAEALLVGGKARELAVLARGLVAAFRGHGVAGEVLAALRLFVGAVAAETVSTELIREIRRKLQAMPPISKR